MPKSVNTMINIQVILINVDIQLECRGFMVQTDINSCFCCDGTRSKSHSTSLFYPAIPPQRVAAGG